mmetsp:Transcript_4035/g.6049  ORF Transcript_4035/g.6049 Transcript_4035/m.6049 type:complete len:87 (+) Transcript_4035:640-900(+)
MSPGAIHLDIGSSKVSMPHRHGTQQMSGTFKSKDKDPSRKSRKSGIHNSVSSLTYERDLTSESNKRHDLEHMALINEMNNSFDTKH